MRKLIIILLLTSIVIAMPMVLGIAEGPKAVEEWFSKLNDLTKEKVTKLHFYFHGIASGKNSTSMPVVLSNATSSSATLFGDIFVADDPLTVGPELHSKTVGRAQGLYSGAALAEAGLLMTMNLVFTDGIYNGSTLSLFGRNSILDLYREMSIVGGTGVFRLARGIATAKTFSFSTTTFNAVVEYSVMIIHY
ncbi:unnamed protein product [Ilex paraguariensis]|uniref:Dirigent protein n=1 Tax=Ilex paraguariensis TaxID=185542 RepID=A0ABC8SY05_9AQUA